MGHEDSRPGADADSGGGRDGGPAGRAYDETPVAMASVTGTSHRLTTCNAAYRMLVGHPAALVGTALPEGWPRPEAEELSDLLDHVHRTAAPEHVTEWCARLHRSADGRPAEVYLDLTVTPYLAAHGTVEGAHLALVDATDRVIARQRASARRRPGSASSAPELVPTLQSELLPVAVPVLPHADVAATYLLPPASARAGGDWFDCLVRPDGTVALVVGDVVGGGVGAVAVMGQLRAVLGDQLSAGTALREAVTRLDVCAAGRPESRAATVCVVVLDPASGDFEYCTAGHPPPLVVRPATGARYLAVSGSAPLGTGGVPRVRSGHLGLGDALLMYTDGILGHPGRSRRTSSQELRRVLGEAVPDGGSPSGAAPRASVRATSAAVEHARVAGYVDDIALLAVERVGAPPPFAVRHHAHPDAVPAVRESLADWLRPLEVEVVDVTAIQHAVGELVTNAVEHSGGSGPAAVTVQASLTGDGLLVCSVADNGRWRDPVPAPPGQGHGLAMVRGLVDDLEVSVTGSGTTAVVRHGLHRPAALLTATVVGAGPDEADDAPVPFALENRGSGVRVAGPLDVTSVDELRILLLQAAQSASDVLTVDLSGVTHLGSAGVQVLHELLAGDPAVRLTAPSGSPAQQVLEVVCLPYEPAAPA